VNENIPHRQRTFAEHRVPPLPNHNRHRNRGTGKAGASPNGAVIFRADRLDAIKTALAAGTPAPAPKGTTDLSEITGKAQAIRRAKLEGLK